MDLKKAYRGAKAALRTAERTNAELRERNYALAYGARPSPKEAQAAQEYVDRLQEELDDLRLYNRELHYDLRDAEARIAELHYLLDRYSERPTKAEAIRLAVRTGLAVVALHALAWYSAVLLIL